MTSNWLLTATVVDLLLKHHDPEFSSSYCL